MSQTKRERKKIAKKHARRKAYVKNRNRLQGRKKKVQVKDAKIVDGAEFYRKLKEKEAAEKGQKNQKERKGNIFTRLLSRVTRGRQNGK